MWSVAKTATITEAAMQRWPVQPLMAASTSAGGHLRIGIGHHDHAGSSRRQRQHALERGGAPPVDVLGNGGRAGEAHSLDARVVEDRLGGLAPSVHHIEDAVAAAPPHAAARRSGPGSAAPAPTASSRNVLPRAMALGNDQCGAIDGKLNGLIEGHHAERVTLEPALDAAAHLHDLTHRDLGQRAGELGQLDGLEDLGLGPRSYFAVLLRHQRAQLRRGGARAGSCSDRRPGPAP